MRSIELTHDQIRLSPHNVRTKLHDDAQIAELAASLLAKGQRSPLEVHPMRGNRSAELYGAFAGGGRYRAFGLLIKRGDVPADFPIRVDVYDDLTDGQLVLASLVENDMRYSLRDFETYKGVVKAHHMGQSVAEIGQALGGRDEHEILQWLRIGELAKPVFDAFGAGRLSLDQARAYGATDDHQLQLAAYEALKGAIMHRPSDIRAFMKFADPVAERELLFVGEAAYLDAGGTLQLDLFAEAGEMRRLIRHPQILRRLVDAKIATLREDLRARAGRDVRFQAKPPMTDFNQPDYLLRVEADASADTIDLPDGDIVGCILLDIDGKPDVSWWWSSRAAKYGEAKLARAPADPAARAKLATKLGLTQPEPDPATDAAALDSTTIEILRSQRRAVMRAALVDDARAGGTIARDYLVFAQLRMLIHPTSNQTNVGLSQLMIEGGPEVARAFVATLPATKVWNDAIGELSRSAVLSADSIDDAWAAFLAAPQSLRDVAAALVTGFALTRSLNSDYHALAIHDAIAGSIGLGDAAGVRRYWAPTEKLLDKLPPEQRIAIAAPYVGEDAIAVWRTARSADVTRRLFALVTGAASWASAQASAAAATWVHPLLRFGPEDPVDPGVNDAAATTPELEAAE
jgi:ParB family chromosome partitioning protein